MYLGTRQHSSQSQALILLWSDLIFVKFGTPRHYLLVLYNLHQKLRKFLTTEPKQADQHFAFSMQKSTPALKNTPLSVVPVVTNMSYAGFQSIVHSENSEQWGIFWRFNSVRRPLYCLMYALYFDQWLFTCLTSHVANKGSCLYYVITDRGGGSLQMITVLNKGGSS